MQPRTKTFEIGSYRSSKVPMRKVTPEQVDLKTENGAEGTYSTMMLKVRLPKGSGQHDIKKCS